MDWEQDTAEADLGADHWAYLDRTERPVGGCGAGDLGLATLSCHTRAQIDPDTGEQSTSEEYVVRDTPLLVNIKGCGYPPDTMCDLFAEKYQNHSRAGETFPCHYSRLELETNLHEVCRCTTTEPLTTWHLLEPFP